MINRVLALLFVLFQAFVCAAVQGQGSDFIHKPKGWAFEENKGQLAEPVLDASKPKIGHHLLSDVRYFGHNGNIYIYCRATGLSFVFTNQQKNQEISESGRRLSTSDNEALTKISTCRIDLVLNATNPKTFIQASLPENFVKNYYLAYTPEQGITGVKSYKTISYHDIYPNIDFVLHTLETGLKYEFVVHPGGKISDISIEWKGLSTLHQLSNGGISYCGISGAEKIIENKPISFIQEEKPNTSGQKIIPSRFSIKSNQITFKVGIYDHTKTLVIDPSLIWGTYYGGTDSDNGHAIATDDAGNVYMTGGTSSAAGMGTYGAFQNVYGGNADILLSEFSANGNLIWSTWYGGDGADAGIAIALDKQKNIFITGYVSSIAGIVTAGAFQTSFGAYRDAFIAKFTNDGQRTWATYFGGTGEDRGYGIGVDPSGNVVVTGFTNSNTMVASPGAFQQNLGSAPGGPGDIFLARFTNDGARIWSTYMGGPEDDRGNALSLDGSGNIYITGITYSQTAMATKNAYQDYFLGNSSDAFVAKFSSSGSRLWCSYYGGESEAHGIAIDKRTNNIYITGDTYDSIPADGISSAGSYQPKYGGGSHDAFLASFSSNGSRLWGTYFGGKAEDDGYAIAIDDSSHIWITGQTNSQSGSFSSNNFQKAFSGGSADAFVAKFLNNGNLVWATCYGGEKSDIAYGIATDPNCNALIAGQTSSSTGMATAYAWQTVYAGKTDVLIAKFGVIYVNDAGINKFLSPIKPFCPDSAMVTVQLRNFGNKRIDSVKVNWNINGERQNPYYWKGILLPDSVAVINLGKKYFASGTCTLKAWTEKPNGQKDSIQENDTARIQVLVYNLPIANAGPDTILCFDETYSMQGSGGITYLWIPARYLSSAIDPNARLGLSDSMQYKLIVKNIYGCADTSSVLLKVRPPLSVKISPLTSPVCYGIPVRISAKGRGGDSMHYQFLWPDDSAKGPFPTLRFYKSGWHRVILSDNCTPLAAMDSIYITVVPPAKAVLEISPVDFVKWKRFISLANHSVNSSSNLWTLGDGDSSKLSAFRYTYKDTGLFKIKLIAYGLEGCPNDTAYNQINVLSGQVFIYIPNAFTPGNGSINKDFLVKGYGIVSYTMKIYNRWGEEVFQSSPSKTNWDGTFKNQPAMEGVYLYMTDVVDIDGDHHYLNGSVTLIR